MNYWRKLKRSFHVLKFTYTSLNHNISRSQNDVYDAAFEPLFWFIDNFTAHLGVIFVIIVICLTTSVVLLWYTLLKPVILTQSALSVLFHFTFGHYLLVNIVFHYVKACFTSPGLPPQGRQLEAARGGTVCKHCIAPKPLRTHHCSVCNTCWLKMDHHCPWMNNCIGFSNHRYFISFCIFMWLGVVYVCATSWDLFFYHFRHPGHLSGWSNQTVPFFQVGDAVDNMLEYFEVNKTSLRGRVELTSDANGGGGAGGGGGGHPRHPGGFSQVHEWEHVGVIYLFFLCGAVSVALGCLSAWHLLLVCRGETSIEVHVNNAERKKAAKHGMGYNNPYDHGWRRNLAGFFGVCGGRRTVLAVVFPSAHAPEGDGMCWPSNSKPVHYTDPQAYDKYQETRSFLRKFSPC